ncbi:hypothetical protein [Olivibacter sitiensis]|uniref:hypothetical protein n=1 Tax=Olivibacter sitiensis TaxID=376470 RepID=UPI00040C916C|nr:hypothetical protein [Olivibacter sitiensis]
MKTKANKMTSPFILLLLPFLFTAICLAGFPTEGNSVSVKMNPEFPKWEIPSVFQAKTIFFW